MVFALTMAIVVSMVGGAVDYGRAVKVRDQMQHAVDAAVLAAARSWQLDGDIANAEARAIEFYNRNKPHEVESALAAFGSDPVRNAISLEARATVAAPFMSLVRLDGFTVEARAEALLAIGGNSEINLEIAMMLDVTGSMSGEKIEDLKAAAKDLIDIVVWDDQSQYTSKVALAPFAPRVNVGDFVSNFTGLPPTRLISGSTRRLRTCVTERIGADEYTDEPPAAGRYLRPYNGITDPSHSSYNNNWSSSGSCSDPSEQIMPLSSDRNALKARIDTFTAGGATAGMLGTSWAWYLLSPKWAHFWPAVSRPIAYGTADTHKIAVLMTDGEYNTWGSGSMSVGTVSSKAATMCTNIKTTGITVYTIGFQLGGSSTAINTLRNCASDVSKFYNAEDGAQLRAAFRDIALQIASLRLSQ
jgi:Flp pilus assembly protein TadG